MASQIQRRFSKYLKSDRTTRRHLSEMESLGYLATVDTINTSPLWPKVYFVTSRGVSRLKKAFHDQGKDWTESAHDRRRFDGYSAQHVLHELFITEFLLQTWESAEALDDLEILTLQRRSLARHNAFKVTVAGRRNRLQPDGMFLYRQKGKGMMCCFVEIDLGTMSMKQIAAKFRRYQAWAESSDGMKYLKSLYAGYGAANPTASFRILMVIGGDDENANNRRLDKFATMSDGLPSVIRSRLLLTVANSCLEVHNLKYLMRAKIWMRLQSENTSHFGSRLAMESIVK